MTPRPFEPDPELPTQLRKDHMSEPCLNPSCSRPGTVRLNAFERFVGHICEPCNTTVGDGGRALDILRRMVGGAHIHFTDDGWTVLDVAICCPPEEQALLLRLRDEPKV